jgi:hypothetical protein
VAIIRAQVEKQGSGTLEPERNNVFLGRPHYARSVLMSAWCQSNFRPSVRHSISCDETAAPEK